ncbi:tRNA pseudouridine synthase A [Echinicola pacifica]|uniref:tRNA pseudouridine synthase A n=2 Tax=Echinicola pacifica TaxID=346377 RepID=A0A918PL89_9BACT|nr:tRNA pseudouridine synthase A [Echinicola pacifica]
MNSKPFRYLFGVQYLGYKYHGWQVQPGVKTIQGLLNRCFSSWLDAANFSILGAGRTDAGVSCEHGYFELCSAREIDMDRVLEEMNSYLPVDIKLLSVKPSPSHFNIIQDVKGKEYRYYFSYGKKPHPFSSPYLVVFPEVLNLEVMKLGAELFVGSSNFQNFCTKPKEISDFQRDIDSCGLEVVGEARPEWQIDQPVYCFSVRGKGFLRNQVRLMMGALVDLGRGELDLANFQKAINGELPPGPICHKAPAEGLVLYEVWF